MAEEIPLFPRPAPAKNPFCVKPSYSASQRQQQLTTLDISTLLQSTVFYELARSNQMSRGGRGGGRGGRGGGRGGRPNVPWDTGEEPDARPSELFPVRIASIHP